MATVKLQGKVTVVSARLVVSVAGSISTVALAYTNVPLGLPALSVSILTLQNAVGLITLASASFRLLPATPEPIAGKLTLVLSATSQIFCSVVACANVGQFSTNTHAFVKSVIGSHSWYSDVIINELGIVIDLSNSPLAFSTGILFSSAAPLEVLTNVVVSATSISISSTSFPAGSIIVFFSPSPAVSFCQRCHTVVSFSLTATYWSADAHSVSVLSVTSAVSSSLNVILPATFLISKLLPVCLILIVVPVAAIVSSVNVKSHSSVESSLLFTAVCISFQNW